MYLPSLQRAEILLKDNLEHAKQLAAWKQTMRNNWNTLKILDVRIEKHDGLKVSDSCTIHAWLDLGKNKSDDLAVELFYGPLDANGEIGFPKTTAMQYLKQAENGNHEFVGTIKLETSGRMGYTVRILPKHPDIDNPFREGLILWAQQQ